MKKKFLKFSLILSLPLVSAVAFASCGYNKLDEKEYDVQKLEGVSALKAKVIKWIDGDTLTIEFLDDSLAFKKGNKKNVRIEGIDTPEKGIVSKTGYIPTEGIEKEYADKVTKFAEKLIPKNSKILYVFNGTKPGETFDRIVGHIYFKDKDNKYKNYSTKIIKEGYTVPNWDRKLFDSDEKVGYYEAPFAYNAFFEAWKNQKNMYKDTKFLDFLSLDTKLKKIYVKHGYGNGLSYMDKNQEDNFYSDYKFIEKILNEE
ncbi:thermonuclease family protein [[Mycoplasma] collis]|uniref:thermonuclease family protein n=1 Tax=[Mycoplasma] collis TaxID=2127 RepID=UPI00068D7320|nr:thermonuclease family protein [[Mycoplasma] collis]